MELRGLVCDLEYSKKLKELGVKQKGIFCWNKYKTLSYHNKMHEKYIWKVEDDSRILNIKDTGISAFTTDELLEMLPKHIGVLDLYIKAVEGKDFWQVCYYSIDKVNNKIIENTYYNNIDYKLPNALAKMLIWIIENGYMEVKK